MFPTITFYNEILSYPKGLLKYQKASLKLQHVMRILNTAFDRLKSIPSFKPSEEMDLLHVGVGILVIELSQE